MTLGSLQTNKSWNVLIGEVKLELDRWGIFENFMMPTKKDSLNTGKVAILVKPKGAEWDEVSCDRFGRELNGPERNLCALREAVRAYRLADNRGIGSVFAQMAKLVALPDPNDPWRLLGITQSDSQERKLEAYRAALKRTHPDTPGGDPDTFMRVKAAGVKIGLV